MPRPLRVHPAEELPEPGTARPHLLAALADAVAASRTSKVEIAELRAAAIARDASMADGGGRVRLAAALAALAERGTVQLPRALDRWDAGPRPRLPQYVRRPARPRPSRSVPDLPAEVAAHLPPATRERLVGVPLRGRDVATLVAVARWLAAGGGRRPIVPARERSLEVFGDEKWLDRPGPLFAGGVLTLDMLRAEAVPVPFVSTWVPGTGSGDPVCLVAENHHTWVSLVRTTQARPTEHGGIHVGFGGGKQFCVSVAGVAMLDPAPMAVSYFGDIDDAGLLIPVRAGREAVAAGLPPVRPASGLYRALVARGVRRSSDPLTLSTAELRAAWLGPLLAPGIIELLMTGNRLPQEAVGSDLLNRMPVESWFRI